MAIRGGFWGICDDCDRNEVCVLRRNAEDRPIQLCQECLPRHDNPLRATRAAMLNRILTYEETQLLALIERRLGIVVVEREYQP